jgi:TPR repeat protein|tara:strand:- start:854 stop:1207 length:354 start_codon:yes stop_codon:yes gene_type:complete
LAANQGTSGAQFNLALMYSNSEGVLQDYAEAARWLKLEAEQGLMEAKFNLAMIYFEGEGVLQDYLQAHMWLNLAAVSGNLKVKEARGLIAENMTSQQIAKTQEMVKECLASQFKDCD